MTLYEALGYFTEETRIMPCLSVTCGMAGEETHALRGVINEQGVPLTEDALFDLASLTKLLTALTVLSLHEEGRLDLSAPVTRYAPEFIHLSEVTVDQVLGFEVGLVTPERVDAQPDRERGLQVLREAAPRDNGDGRAYSDMHSMVLKYVIEGAAAEGSFAVIRSRILQPLGMTETFAHVPQALRHRCVSCDREHRIEGEKWLLREGVAPGTPHDPKARLLCRGEDVCGHAGLFATRRDMVRLCQGLLKEQVISRKTLLGMSRNRTGRRRADGSWTQFLGSQCYVKHPCQYHSEIPVYMSDRAIGLSGFTGHHLAVDAERGIFTLFLGSRVMNRLTVLIPEKGRSLMDYGLRPDGVGTIPWPDGSRIASSVQYVHQKDEHLHRVVMATMGLAPWRSPGSEWP